MELIKVLFTKQDLEVAADMFCVLHNFASSSHIVTTILLWGQQECTMYARPHVACPSLVNMGWFLFIFPCWLTREKRNFVSDLHLKPLQGWLWIVFICLGFFFPLLLDWWWGFKSAVEIIFQIIHCDGLFSSLFVA